jgi:hypothetical protein
VIVEFLIIATAGLAPAVLGEFVESIESGRMPRPIYALTTAWWKGAFSPETPASSIATMLDSDYSCEIWYKQNSTSLKSESLGTEVNYYGYGEKCSLWIKKKDGRTMRVDVSDYDDYLLSNAFVRWKKRQKRLEIEKKNSESQRLIDERITQGYIKTVEMIEKKILGNAESETANELEALIKPLEPPKENKVVNTVYYIVPGSSTAGSVQSEPSVRKTTGTVQRSRKTNPASGSN